ncbi:MAG: NADH-quinone oxidoreductase subunit N [Coriobacteriia bacterium]
MVEVPLPLLVPALIALAGVVVALLADSFERPAAALRVLIATLFAAGVSGLVLLPIAEVYAGSLFGDHGGFVSLGSLGYLLASCALIAGSRRLADHDQGVATGALMALGSVFAASLVAALDVTVLFVSLSGLGVVGYAVVAAADTPRAEGSAVRYFVQGTIASGLTVYALAVFLGLTGGDASYSADAGGGVASPPLLLAMAFMLSALGFKAGTFPFHSWVPDAYESAHPPVAAYLASVPKIAGVTALLVVARGAWFGGDVGETATVILGVVALGSLLFGGFGMLRQRNVARLLGYSAIAQVGYAVMGTAAGTSGASAVPLFIATYAIAACAAFVGLEAIDRVRPDWDGTLRGLSGLSRQAPWLSAAMAVVLLSLTGMPPLAGFWGKLLVLTASVDAGMEWLAVLGGMVAVVSFGGYGAVIRSMYFDTPTETDGKDRPERQGAAIVVLLLLAAALFALGVLPLASGLGPMVSLLGM